MLYLKRENSFHTTQYDLNERYYARKKASLERFPYYIVRFKRHQYHLLFFVHERFPYYIVRFKQKTDISEVSISPTFPYYIVRFKLSVCAFKILTVSKFPYYIVRFKLIPVKEPLILGLRFHTTQYDLNYACRICRIPVL